MDTLLRDFKLAIRSLRHHKGLVLVASVSLALGIAVNVTIFSAVNTLVWTPLAYPEPDRLVHVWQNSRERGWDQSSVSLPNFQDWRTQSRSMKLAAYTSFSFNLSTGGEPERIDRIRASGVLLPLLGASYTLGSGFAADDEAPGGPAAVVLTHRIWLRRFDADSSLLGRAILLDGEPHTVLGVLSPTFRFDLEPGTDLIAPLVASAASGRGNSFLRVLGRLAPGATTGSANAEISQIATRLAREYPVENATLGAYAIPLIEEVVEEQPRQAAMICLVAVAFVLLIACANVANLLLARATGRDRELAVRAAIGANRGRLIREMLTESMVLAGFGGAGGLALSFVGVGWFRSIVPADFPRLDLLGMDWEAFSYAAVITVLTGLIFGIAPALRSSRPDLVTSLRDGGRAMTGLRHGKLLAVLTGAEVALALVLLISAGLLIKGSRGLSAVDPGFEPTNALSFRTSLSEREYPDSGSVLRFQDQLLERLGGLDGVTAAGAGSQLPLTGGSGTTYLVEGEPEPEVGRKPVAQWRAITPSYLPAIGIRLRQGRDILATDRAGTPLVVLVNEAMAKRHWAGINPIGRRIKTGETWREIVGVVQDTREFGLDDEAPPTMFLPAGQGNYRRMSYVLRTTRDPTTFSGPVRDAVKALAPNQPVYQLQSLEAHLAGSVRQQQIMPNLLSVFGVLALLLAVIGVYGVMSYAVAQRTQEIGIRRTLGANRSAIIRMVVWHAMKVCGAGAVVGLVLASLVTRTLATFLIGVSPFDPGVFAGVTFALLGAALVASLIPARRAAGIEFRG